MKTIFFGKGDGHIPFWMPWGAKGCGLWFLYAILLAILVFLLALFRSCDEPDPRGFPDAGEEVVDDGDNWNRDFDETPRGLPEPGDNFIPEPNPDEMVPNPDDGGATQIVPNQLYVIIDAEDPEPAVATFAERFVNLYPQPEHKINYYNINTGTLMLTVPTEKRDQIMRDLPGQITELNFMVVPVELMTAGYTPNDPAFRKPETSWQFDPIQAREAWDITKGSDGIVIGIVDSYFDINHPELAGDKIVGAYSVPKRTADVAPEGGVSPEHAGHGTFVASCAAANMNNSSGTAGIAPDCRIMPVSMGKVFTNAMIAEGILYCIYNGADVVNVSCGQYFTDAILQWPVDKQVEFSQNMSQAEEKMWNYVFKLANERNIPIVWAAGNQSVYSPMDATKRDNQATIIVSAVDRDLKRADFSNFGNIPNKDLNFSTVSAPGVDIYGAIPNARYESWPGTSFSAPIVAGAIALMKSLNPALTTSEIITILKETGKPVAGHPEIGPLIQIKDALKRVQETMPAEAAEQ